MMDWDQLTKNKSFSTSGISKNQAQYAVKHLTLGNVRYLEGILYYLPIEQTNPKRHLLYQKIKPLLLHRLSYSV